MTGEEFAQAVTAHSHAMFRAARAVLDRDADAEDAVAQAVLLAWQSRDRLRRSEAVRAWLVKIAVNCARRQRHKSGRLLPLEHAEQLPASEDQPGGAALWDAVLSLPREGREVVTLFYYEDMTLRQIARTLGVPQGTVKSRLSRARQRLRELLCEEDTT